MKETKKIKRHLSTSVFIASAVFAVVMIFSIGTLGYVTYSNAMTEKYQQYLDGILKMTLEHIDGDDLQNCRETGVLSEQYQKTKKYFDTCKIIYDIAYIYIVVPLNDSDFNNLEYLMVGVSQEEIEEGSHVNFRELTGNEFSSEVARYYLDAMKGGNKITYYPNTTSFGYMYTGLVPVFNSKNEAIAILSVDISMNDLYNTMKRYIVMSIAGGAVLFALFLVVISAWLRKRITAPIAELERAAGKYVDDSRTNKDPETLNFEIAKINTGDEIESLFDSMVSMSEDIKKYTYNLMTETKEKERIASELSVARNIQLNMLPKIFPLLYEKKEIDLYATMNPAKEVGGDFYDFFMIDDRHICLVIADVSGKGVPAALFMVIAKTLIKNHLQKGESLDLALTEVNNQLLENNEEMLFVTVWAGILDFVTGDVEYIDAGHEVALLLHNDSSVQEIKAAKKQCPLSAIEDIQYKKYSFKLEPGNRLFLYTDGVPEATNADKQLYGMQRLESILALHTADTPEQILAAVHSDVDKFVGDAPQFDDLTMLCLHYKKRMVVDLNK